jgi:hypothetical protein
MRLFSAKDVPYRNSFATRPVAFISSVVANPSANHSEVSKAARKRLVGRT